MARLRSALRPNSRSRSRSRSCSAPLADSAWGVQISHPTFSRITEQSTKLNAIIEQCTPDTRPPPISPDSLFGRSSQTPLSPSSSPPPAERPYLSLGALLKTPTMSRSKIPSAVATAGRKVGTFSTNSGSDPMTPVKAAFQVPEGKSGFGFRSGLAMTGRKIMDSLTGKKFAPSPSPPATPAVAETPSRKQSAEPEQTPRGSQTEPRPKRKKRFSDIHRQQFAKMDSIANHYAAKRTPATITATTPSTTPSAPKSMAPEITPKNALVQTPEIGLKNLKRAKSQAILGDREPPSSPSPQKRRPDTDPDSGREEERSPVKRQRLDTAAVILERKASKIARFAGAGVASTPMKKPAFRNTAVPNTVGGALNRNLALKAASSRCGIPALQKPVSTLNLTPSTTLSTPATTAAPSKIPATPGRVPSLRHPRQPPATIGASKLNTMINFSEASQSTPAKPSTTVGGFTFRSRRGPSGLGFNALSEIHDKKATASMREMMKFESRMGTPKVSENDPVGVEDPFAEGKEMKWSAGTPANGKKRKCEEEHRADDRNEGSEDEKIGELSPSTSPAPEAEPPVRKRLRFESEEAPQTPGRLLEEAVAKANNRRKRLNFLATPRKKVAGEGDRLGKKGLWQ